MTAPQNIEPSAEAAMCLALLHVLTETRVQLGLDPDGSLTTDRVLAWLGTYDQLTRCSTAPDAEAWTASRAAVRGKLKQLAPLVSRLSLAAAANEP